MNIWTFIGRNAEGLFWLVAAMLFVGYVHALAISGITNPRRPEPSIDDGAP